MAICSAIASRLLALKISATGSADALGFVVAEDVWLLDDLALVELLAVVCAFVVVLATGLLDVCVADDFVGFALVSGFA